MNQEQLRKNAREFAESQVPAPCDSWDMLYMQDHEIDYLIAMILGKNPNMCFCDEPEPLRRPRDGRMICRVCEKPVE